MVKKDDVTHFIYPYIIPKNPVFGWELMYSIRSLYQFYDDPFDITIIGEIPQWLDTAKCLAINLDNSDPKKYPRVQSRTNEKILLAADLYNDFVMMHDDMYLIDNLNRHEITKTRFLSDDLLYQNTTEETKKLTRYQQQLRYTSLLLKEMKKPYIRNYANHAPFYFRSDKLKIIAEKFNLLEPKNGYITVVENAYYNYFEDSGEYLAEYRVGYWGKETQGNMKTAKILNHDENGFLNNSWLLSFIDALLPKKSPLEK
jgi:hypothetical protein